MNLSDHSESIFKSIQQLKDGVKRLTEDDGLDWLTRMFKGWGLSGSLITLVKTVGVVLLTVVTVLSTLPCLTGLLQRALQRTVGAMFLAQDHRGVWIAQKQIGGFVASLENSGHVVRDPDQGALL